MLMPEWLLTAAAWIVMLAGLACVACLVPFAAWLAVQVLLYLRDNGFRRDVESGANFILWRALRMARSDDANALRWASPEVEKWAKDRVRSVLKMDKEVTP